MYGLVAVLPKLCLILWRCWPSVGFHWTIDCCGLCWKTRVHRLSNLNIPFYFWFLSDSEESYYLLVQNFNQWILFDFTFSLFPQHTSHWYIPLIFVIFRFYFLNDVIPMVLHPQSFDPPLFTNISNLLWLTYFDYDLIPISFSIIFIYNNNLIIIYL